MSLSAGEGAARRAAAAQALRNKGHSSADVAAHKPVFMMKTPQGEVAVRPPAGSGGHLTRLVPRETKGAEETAQALRAVAAAWHGNEEALRAATVLACEALLRADPTEQAQNIVRRVADTLGAVPDDRARDKSEKWVARTWRHARKGQVLAREQGKWMRPQIYDSEELRALLNAFLRKKYSALQLEALLQHGMAAASAVVPSSTDPAALRPTVQHAQAWLCTDDAAGVFVDQWLVARGCYEEGLDELPDAVDVEGLVSSWALARHTQS